VVAAGGKWLASDINTLIALTLNRPLVRLQQQAAQSIPSTTDTAITFGAGSEDIDTHGFHDTSTNTSRVTPTVAGYYQVSGNVWWGNTGTLKSYHAAIARNGSVVARNRVLLPNATVVTDSTTRSHSAFAILSANGTSDYFELVGQQQLQSAASLSTSASGSFSSTLEVIYLRPL
jgi:hypothetical protein